MKPELEQNEEMKTTVAQNKEEISAFDEQSKFQKNLQKMESQFKYKLKKKKTKTKKKRRIDITESTFEGDHDKQVIQTVFEENKASIDF